MAVEFDKFHEWCKERFGEANLKMRHTANGDEICTHSFIAEEAGKEDHKYHLWMNPSGGKTGSTDHGAWRCWKTDKFGTLVGLVAKVDNIPYEEAEELICDAPSLRTLEAKVHEFFGFKEEQPVEIVKDVAELQLPEFTSYIDDLSPTNNWKIQAKQYLDKRGLPTAGLCVCMGGDRYKNRIVIPYYDREGRLRFYNCRTMSSSKKTLRYRKCEEPDSSQDDILFFYRWPRKNQKIYITEGEFDAISLNLCGFNGCACGGKFLSDNQIEIIRNDQLIPVLAFDADSSGREAILNIGEKLLSMGFVDINYVRPPKAFKDWNKMMIDRNKHVVKAYIERFEQRYTVDTLNLLKCGSLGS